MDRMVRIIVEKLDPDKVILFGPYAWGEPNEDSDVDILVVTKWVFEWLAEGQFMRIGDLWISPNGWYSKPCHTCGGTGWVDGDGDSARQVGCPDCGGDAYGQRGKGYVELSERRETKSDVRPAQLAAEASLACRPRGLALDLIVKSPADVEHRLSIGDPFIKRIMDRGKALYVR